MEIMSLLQAAAGICAHLAEIHHRNEFHGDLGPHTLITRGDGGMAVLKPASAQKLSQYTSPEQTGRINRIVDYRTDLYSLGIFMYHELTGRLPFECNDDFELIHAIVARKPEAPGKLNPAVPATLSQIVMKLLSKNAEDRYQSATGLKHDLDRCLSVMPGLKDPGQLKFVIGAKDHSGRFEIPQKLYGREKECAFLSDLIDQISSRHAGLLLITGFAGIGKSSLVNEVRDQLPEKQGFFITGKYEIYKRSIPYSALIQAFTALVRQLLTESPARLEEWKTRLQHALTVNGQVLVDVIPELELIIGKQPPAAELGPMETQNRFHFVIERVIEVLTRKENPLVIFLDDLQWIDHASLSLMELLLADPANRSLLLVGAYREHEIDDHHPLMRTLKNIEDMTGSVHRILLKPLDEATLGRIVADTLKCTENEVRPLARLCMKKTEGNPFYFKQFLASLYHLKAIVYSEETNSWTWDMGKIESMKITDNMAEFMISKIRGLPAESREVLVNAAALGNQFSSHLLVKLVRKTPGEVQKHLLEAVNQNFLVAPGIERTDLYRFAHDQVHRAVYSLIPDEELKALHLKIGRMLLDKVTEMTDEGLFDLIGHLNIARELIAGDEEKMKLDRLNLQAGTRAKRSVAYADALAFFRTAVEVLPGNSWEDHYALSFDIHHSLIECSLLAGDLAGMDEYIRMAGEHVTDVTDSVRIRHIKILSFYSVSNPAEAVRYSFETLALLGIAYPAEVTADDIGSALNRIAGLLRDRPVESLLDLPSMKDQEKIETLRIISSLLHGIYFVAPQYFPLVAATCVELSVKHGNAPNSIAGYAVYGLVLCAVTSDYEKGNQFGQLAMNLLAKTGYREYTAMATVIYYNLIAHWRQRMKLGIGPLKEAHQTGMETGDIAYAVDCVHGYCFYSFFTGKSLDYLCDELASYQSRLTRLKQENSLHYIMLQIYHQAFENLVSKDEEQELLKGSHFNEDLTGPDDLKTRGMTGLFVFYAFKSFAGFLFEKYDITLEYLALANANMAGAASTYHIPFVKFIESLTLLAGLENEQDPGYEASMARIGENRQLFATWAANAPMNHEHNLLLIDAEIARVKGNISEAIGLFERAITMAGQHEFIYHEAIAYERAAKFWLVMNNERFAHTYLSEAYRCYKTWGAEAKCRHLKKVHAGLSTRFPSATAGFDESSIIRASQVLSGELRLPELLRKLMSLAIENAGAERGFLILDRNGELFIEAEASAAKEAISVMESLRIDSTEKLPQGIIHFVHRTKRPVVLGYASEEGDFRNDRYIIKNHVKSLMCKPLLTQGNLIGLLYLENNLLPHAFSEERVEILRIIVLQAAISIENALLVNNLEMKVSERTAELAAINEELVSTNEALLKAKEMAEASEKLFNTLLEHSPIYIFVKDPEFRVVKASPNFFNLVGRSPSEMAGKSMHELFPEELARQILEDDQQVLRAGIPMEFEEQMGDRFFSTIKFPIRMEGKKTYLAGFTIDITGRKQAEMQIHHQNEELRELNATKDKFFSIIAHDLRSPFNSLLGFSELLLDNLDHFERDIVQQQVSIIHRISSQTYKLLEDILLWAQMQTGTIPFEPENLLFYETCCEVIGGLVESAGNKDITIDLPANENLILKADANMFKTVIRNLLSNAVKFTNPGGRIRISCEKGPEESVIAVSDNGVGIQEKDIPKLWDIATSFSTPGTMKEKGTGIGLTLCKEFVERHGGRIWVKSEPGKGSCFSFTIPVKG